MKNYFNNTLENLPSCIEYISFYNYKKYKKLLKFLPKSIKQIGLKNIGSEILSEILSENISINLICNKLYPHNSISNCQCCQCCQYCQYCPFRNLPKYI